MPIKYVSPEYYSIVSGRRLEDPNKVELQNIPPQIKCSTCGKKIEGKISYRYGQPVCRECAK